MENNEQKPKRRRGRPSEYNFEMCKEICRKVAEGGNIKTILDENKKYPDFSTWCRWKQDNGELYNLYISSIQNKSEAIEKKLADLEQQLIDGKITHNVYNSLTNTYKWQLAKYYPKMYGERTQVDLSGEVQTTNLTLSDEERQQRIAELLLKAKQ